MLLKPELSNRQLCVPHKTIHCLVGVRPWRRHGSLPVPADSRLICFSKSIDAKESLKELRRAPAPSVIDPNYLAASNYLKSIGFTNPAELSRVMDIATNPNSLFVSYDGGKRSKNASARPLDDNDMRVVVEFLQSKGVSVGDVVKVISGHPPVLSYSQQRLEGFWSYLGSLGVQDVGTAVVKRPNILGLEVDASLRKIVEYLQYIETPPEQIVKYVTETI